jgi:hypothetical protein
MFIWPMDGLHTHQSAILSQVIIKYVRENPNARFLSDCQPHSVMTLMARENLWRHLLAVMSSSGLLGAASAVILCF